MVRISEVESYLSMLRDKYGDLEVWGMGYDDCWPSEVQCIEEFATYISPSNETIELLWRVERYRKTGKYPKVGEEMPLPETPKEGFITLCND